MLIVAVVASAGLPSASLRAVARFYEGGGSALIRAIRGQAFIRLTKWSLFTLAAVAIFQWVFPDVGFQRRNIVWLAIVAGILLAVIRLQAGIIRGADFPLLALWPDLLGRHLFLLVAGGVLLGLDGSLSVEDVFLATLGILLMLAIVQEVAFLSKLEVGVRPVLQSPGHYSGVAIAGVNLFFILSIAQSLIDRIDVLIASNYVPSSEIGGYYAATRVASLIIIPLATSNVFFGAKIAGEFERDNLVAVNRYIRQALWFGLLPVLPLVLLIIFQGAAVLRLFDASFDAAYPSLLVLSAAQLINVLCGPALVILNMSGNVRDSVAIFLVTLALGVASYLVAIPEFGVLGAALVTAAMIILWNGLAVIMVMRRTGINILTCLWK